MRKLGAIFAIVLLGALAGCSAAGNSQVSGWTRFSAAVRARFTNGDAAIREALANKAKATSWKMRTEMRLHPGDPLVTESQVSCPDHQKLIGSMGNRQLYEAVRVGNTMYQREIGKPWEKKEITSEFYPCGSNVGIPAPWAIMNEGADFATVLAKIVGGSAKPTVTVGSFDVVAGTPCQNWEMQFGHPGGKSRGPGLMNYMVCVAADTHLPVRISMGKGSIAVEYSEWNKPLSVEAPPASEVEVAKAPAR